MARHDAKWTPDTDAPPASAPKTRDELVQENRAGRDTEETTAPAPEPGTEGGSPGGVAPSPRTEPVRTHVVNSTDETKRDVRAGPGDAGAADTPTRQPEPIRENNSSWHRAAVIAAIVIVVWVLLALII